MQQSGAPKVVGYDDNFETVEILRICWLNSRMPEKYKYYCNFACKRQSFHRREAKSCLYKN